MLNFITKFLPKYVYVVAWESASSGGFDWYYNKKDMDKAYLEELKNCKNYKQYNWNAMKFKHQVGSLTSATKEVSDYLDVTPFPPIKEG